MQCINKPSAVSTFDADAIPDARRPECRAALQGRASGSRVFCVGCQGMKWQSLDADGSCWMSFVAEGEEQGYNSGLRCSRRRRM